jgi:DNA-binding GntR family transcriptional regulator
MMRKAQPADALAHTTYEAMKTAILGNRLRPGVKLTHRVLADMFGVSRTPVRESLERLLQEGYVTRVANRGYFVAEMQAAAVAELYQTREALETYSLGMVMQRGVAKSEMRALEKINARYGELCKDDLSRERLLVDRDFHMALAALSGNAYLCRSLRDIFDRLILKRRVEGFHGFGTQPHLDHVKLLAAIGEGNRRAAEQVLRGHIDGACKRFMQYLESLAGGVASEANSAI